MSFFRLLFPEKKNSLPILGCLFSLVSHAQSFHYRHYTSFDGLSNPQVFCITQDSWGYIWIGTDDGLDRFDGKKFTVYKKENGLPGNSITALAADGHQLMIGCYTKGIVKLSNDSCQLLNNSHQAAFAVGITKFQDQFFLAPATSLNQSLRFTATRFDTIKISQNYLDSERYFFSQFLATTDHQLLLTGDAGIFKWNGKSFDPVLATNEQQYMDAIAEGDNHIVFAGGVGKILMIREGSVTGVIKNGLPPGKKVHRILFDHNGRMWISVSGAGLYLYDHGNMKFMNPEFGLGNVSINALFLDRQNNLWICTYGQGIYCLSDVPFTSYTTADGLPNNFIYCFLPTLQGMLCGTFNGPGLFSGGKFEKIKLPVGSEEATLSMVNIGRDSVAIPYYDNIPHSFYAGNITRNHLTFFQVAARHLFEGASSSFLFQRTFKLLNYLPDQARIDTIFRFPGAELINLNDVKKIDDKYYCATNMGLLIWDGINFKILNHEKKLVTDQVNAIEGDHNHKIWFATDAGLYCLINDSVIHYTEHDGLPDNNCTSLVFDRTNNLWIGTSYGISRFDGRKFDSYNTSDGLIGNAVNTLSYDSLNNRLWIGTMSGISVFNPSAPPPLNYRDIPLYISGLKVNGKLYTHDFPSEFSSGNNNLSFRFAALDYTNPDEVVYRYRLAGLDNNWQEVAANEVQFAALRARNYTFIVQAFNRKGKILSQPVTFSFKIIPSLQDTNGFRIAIIILAIALLFSGFYFYLRFDRRRRQLATMKHQREREREMIKEMEISNLRQQALNAMMNPHFVFNALGSIQHYMNQNDTDAAAHYLSSFARLIRKNLNSTRKAFITLDEELEQLKLYLEIEKMRMGEKLNYVININENAEADICMIPTMLLQPVVENSILHGLLPKSEGGKISILVETEKEILRIVIEDDGIGIAASQVMKENSLHQSMGLEIMKKRLQLLSEKFSKQFSVSAEAVFPETQEGMRLIFLLPMLDESEVTQ